MNANLTLTDSNRDSLPHLQRAMDLAQENGAAYHPTYQGIRLQSTQGSLPGRRGPTLFL